MIDRNRIVSALFDPQQWTGWKASVSLSLGASMPSTPMASSEYLLFGLWPAAQIAAITGFLMLLYGVMLIVIALPKFVDRIGRGVRWARSLYHRFID